MLDVMRHPFTLDGMDFPSSAALVWPCIPQDGRSLDELIKTGGYRHVPGQGARARQLWFYQPQMNAHLLERMQMEYALNARRWRTNT